MTGSSTPPSHPGDRAHAFRPAPPPFADSSSDWPGSAPEQRAGRWRRALNLLAVFMVGGGVGVAADWWLNKPPPVARPTGTAVQREDGRKPPAPASLPTGELPYDGVIDGEGALPVPRVPYFIEPSSEDLPDDDKPRKLPEAQPKGKEGPTAKPPASGTGKARAAGASSSGTADKKSGSGPGASATSRVEKPAPRKASARSSRDGEFDRIRQQATDELWRKRVRERMPDQSAAPRRSPALPVRLRA